MPAHIPANSKAFPVKRRLEIRATKASNSFERKEKSQKYFTIHILQSKNISLNKKIMYGDKNGGTFKDGDIDRSFKLDPLTNRDLEQ